MKVGWAMLLYGMSHVNGCWIVVEAGPILLRKCRLDVDIVVLDGARRHLVMSDDCRLLSWTEPIGHINWDMCE